MAIVIEHGHNGSYKSSSVIWYRLLPALRQGRLVVTNVAGMYPLHKIEEFLGEKFPETARLFRMSSQDPRYQKLWRVWHHWMPIGAFVFIDECQDIYDRDVFSGKSEYDIQPIEYYDSILPADFISLYRERLDTYRPDHLEECDMDDTGRVVFDGEGRIIYPTTPKESFMRHRHYNWDVVLATPDITSIPRPVRACCETAFAYNSKDSFFLSKRKPRIYEHNPLENGIPTQKSVTFKRHVPVAVHRLYKSTQTGNITKSGQSKGPFSSLKLRAVLFGVLPLSLCWFGYNLYHFLKPPVAVAQAAADVGAPQSVVAPAGTVGVPVPYASAAGAVANRSAEPFLMPFRVTELFMTGASGAIYAGRFEGLVIFSGVRGNQELAFNSDDLMNMGYKVDYLGDCYSVVTDRDGRAMTVNCAPRIYNNQPAMPEKAAIPESVVQLASLTNVAS